MSPMSFSGPLAGKPPRTIVQTQPQERNDTRGKALPLDNPGCRVGVRKSFGSALNLRQRIRYEVQYFDNTSSNFWAPEGGFMSPLKISLGKAGLP